ncbi:hypothetical protein [Megalodesulfovibrio paquesii]
MSIVIFDGNDPVALAEDYPNIATFDPRTAFADTEYVQRATRIGQNRYFVGAKTPDCTVHKQRPNANDCWAASLRTMFEHGYAGYERDAEATSILSQLTAQTEAGDFLDILEHSKNRRWGMDISHQTLSSHQITEALARGKYVLVYYNPTGAELGHAVLIIGATFAMGYPGKYPGPAFETLYILDPDPNKPLYQEVQASEILRTASLAASFNTQTNPSSNSISRRYQVHLNDRCKFLQHTGIQSIYRVGCF